MMYKHKSGICIRKLDRKDLPVLLELKQESWWGTHTTPFLNEDDQNHWFDNLSKDCLVIVCQVDNSIAAVFVFSDIHWISRVANISGSVIKSYRRKDVVNSCFASAVDFGFEMLNLHRLDAEVLEYNLPAQQVEIGYLGLTPEGRRREAVYKCGRYYDSIVLGLLRSDWEKHDRIVSCDGCCNEWFDLSLIEKMKTKSKFYLGSI